MRDSPISKTETRTWLSHVDAESIFSAVVREKTFQARSDVLRQKDVPDVAHLLLEGNTFRYKILGNGRRQITAVLVPGDVCDLEAVMRGQADYSVGAATTCVLGEIPAARITNFTKIDPLLAKNILSKLLRDEAICREWLVGMGCRSALQRLAHFLCEFRTRLEPLGMAQNGEFQLGFTQVDMAAILGLSIVHVNRTMQEIRRSGLIAFSAGTLTILDIPALEAVAGFDPAYLRMP